MNLKAKEEDLFDILLKDGEIIDPAQGNHFVGSLAIKNGRIAALGKDLSGDSQKVIPLQGKILTPGLIDLHCHPSLGFFGDGKGRESLRGNRLLEPRMVFKAGEIRPAYSRYHIPPLFQ